MLPVVESSGVAGREAKSGPDWPNTLKRKTRFQNEASSVAGPRLVIAICFPKFTDHPNDS